MLTLVPKKCEKWILPLLISFRVINAVITSTFFQADEFWQALEPAHFKAFGYGGLTWEWKYGLRSYGFPFLFELAYRSVRIVSKMICFWIGANNSRLFEEYGVIYVPKITMAIIAALGDFYTILLVRRLYLLTLDKTDDNKAHDDWEVTKIALCLTSTNFFNCFIITRTFINSFEMCLTSVALYYWDWSGGEEIFGANFTKSLIVALFACWQRPTNGLIWIVLGGFLIGNMASKGYYKEILHLLAKVTLSLGLVILFSSAIDLHFYGKIIFPPLLFYKLNVMSPLSTFYGVNQWHFHITQSLPLILNYSIPLFLLGLWTVYVQREVKRAILSQIVAVMGFNLLAYSILSHKEFRFIYPLQPLFMIFSALGALKLRQKYTIRPFVYFIPLISVMSAFLLSRYHESGTISVMKYLHGVPTIDSLGFMMPCHSTPWQSYLHRPDINELWAITCDPPLHLMNDADAAEQLDNYMDESDLLYNDVHHFIEENFPPSSRSIQEHIYNHSWPEYLIIFEHLEKALDRYLAKANYTEEIRFFNSFAHWDHRRKGAIIVYHKL